MAVAFASLLAIAVAIAAPTVPTEVQQPGTQPGQVATFTSPNNCESCHANVTQPVNPGAEKEREPSFGWRGSMMGNAGRDPLFWATLAIAEQDFLPNPDPALRGGAGDLCIRCHSVGGWIGQRSTPTDGSGLQAADKEGVECEFCHQVVDPDQPVNIVGTIETYSAPFEPYDATPPYQPYRGSGQYVLNGNGTRLGPYSDAVASHVVLPSPFHRQSEMCSTCHDVSNPVVGDLAHNNGTQNQPLAPGTFSGVLGSPAAGKAAFNNAPYKYGVVERTSSEHIAGAFDTLLVSDFANLPTDLKTAGGSIQRAFARANDQTGNPNRPNYKDGTPRTFSCQTCHMSASTGKGCNKPNVPTREDLPRHDLTGAAHWVTDAIKYMDVQGTLRLGGGLTQTQRDALDAGKIRAQDMLKSAASLSATQQGSALKVRVTNLTGHKLITGYPEGRRMWLNLKWFNGANVLIAENGGYGPIGRSVNDNAGVPRAVESLLDLEHTVVYEANPGMDQQWAAQLLGLGYPAGFVLGYDRLTDAVTTTLGQLAASPAGTQVHTFHFVLNNVIAADDRIPPYGFKFDEAKLRNALPVPAALFGNAGPGGTYNYWDDRSFAIPAGAARVEVRLFYQQTSWEYVEFLWKNNDGLNGFLGAEGRNLLDAWLNTGMAAPLEMTALATSVAAPTVTPGEASDPTIVSSQMRASFNKISGAIDVAYAVPCSAADHRIVYGPLSGVATCAWSGTACDLGTTGNTAFDPGGGNAFFVIVANDAAAEGSYGTDSHGTERSAAAGVGACDLPQALASRCDP